MQELLELGGLTPLPQDRLGLEERVKRRPHQPRPAERNTDRMDAIAQSLEHPDDVGLAQ